jgi:hypothetical protein
VRVQGARRGGVTRGAPTSCDLRTDAHARPGAATAALRAPPCCRRAVRTGAPPGHDRLHAAPAPDGTLRTRRRDQHGAWSRVDSLTPPHTAAPPHARPVRVGPAAEFTSCGTDDFTPLHSVSRVNTHAHRLLHLDFNMHPISSYPDFKHKLSDLPKEAGEGFVSFISGFAPYPHTLISN